MSLRERAREGFFRHGWLLPLAIVAGYAFGRALAVLLLLIYLLWAALALRRDDLPLLPRPLLLLHAVWLIGFGLGIPWALDGKDAAGAWLKLLGMGAALPITWIALRRVAGWRAPLAFWAALACALVMAKFLGGMALAGLVQGWEGMAKGHNGMIAACLFPLALAPLLGHRKRYGRHAAMALTLMFLLALVFKDSRTEVLMVLSGLATLVAFHTSRRQLLAFLAGAILLTAGALAVMHKGNTWDGTSGDGAGWFAELDIYSSGRLTLWRGALEHPPANPWVGVGLLNVRHYREVFGGLAAKHLHNLFLDTWYDAGGLGLIALLALLGHLGGRALRGLHPRRDGSAPWLAATAATLVTLQLDHSYNSVTFAPFLLFVLAVLARIAEEGAPRPPPGQVEAPAILNSRKNGTQRARRNTETTESV